MQVLNKQILGGGFFERLFWLFRLLRLFWLFHIILQVFATILKGPSKLDPSEVVFPFLMMTCDTSSRLGLFTGGDRLCSVCTGGLLTLCLTLSRVVPN